MDSLFGFALGLNSGVLKGVMVFRWVALTSELVGLIIFEPRTLVEDNVNNM